MQPIPILMYHSVSDQIDERYRKWAVTPARFSSHMKILSDQGYSVLGVSAVASKLEDGLPLPEKLAVLTFDDGLQDFLTGAFPILEQYRFQATLFVVAGRINETSRWLAPLGEGERPMLRAEEIRVLHSRGIEIGAHSLTHPELDLLEKHECENEIRGSRLMLEQILGADVRTFAYPHGYATAATRRIVQEAGFQSAVRVCHALSDASEDRFGLSRLIVTQDCDPVELISLVEGKGIQVAPPQDRFQKMCWRLARRIRNKLLPQPDPGFHFVALED
ncbi:MAG: polysaccharide deacetylase family protein [Roseibium sp.]